MDDREKYLQEESAQEELKADNKVLEEEYPFDSNPSAEAIVKWQRILRQIEHELKVADDDKRRAAFQFSLGEIQQTRFGRKDKAIQYYQKAFESDRRHKPTIRAAISLFREAGMWEMVAELMEALTECDLSQSEQVELYIEQASIFGDHLNQSGRAAKFLLKALDLDPANSSAFTKLERLRIKGEDRHALMEFYSEFAANPAFRHWNGMLNMRLAQLMEKSQENWEEAIEKYRMVLEIEPDNLVALDALRRLLSKHERWLELLDLYGEEESATEEPERLALLKYQRARILSEQLDDIRSAQTLLREGLELDPENGLLLDELEGLYENSHQWAEQADIRRMLFVLASSLEERVELAFRLGALYDEKLNDIDHAADWYEKSIELNPGYLPALQVLERLYERAERYERLFEVLVKQAAATDDKKLKATKHFMAAEVAQQHLNDPELVIEQYKKVLDLMPGYLPAVKALSELFTFLGRPRGVHDRLVHSVWVY